MSMSDAMGDLVREATYAASSDMDIDTYELRQILSVATTYLDNGMIEDAEDLLQEMMESNSLHPEVDLLAGRIESARAQSAMLSEPRSEPEQAEPRHLIHFTRPLPGADRLPRDVQRLIVDSEHDYQAGRLEAALDSTMVALSMAPAFVPIYVRLAQLRIAAADIRGAREIVTTLERRLEFDDHPYDGLLSPVRIALDVDDTDALVAFARRLLEQNDIAMIEPFVPAAIEATLMSEPGIARELSREFVRLRPHDDEAVRAYLRSAVTGADLAEVTEAFKSYVGPDTTAPDLLYLRALVASNDDRSWVHWLERAVEITKANPEMFAQVQSAIDASARFVPVDKRNLSGAVLALGAGQFEAALRQTDEWQRTTSFAEAAPVEAFIVACARAEAIDRLGLAGSLAALETAIDLAVHPDVEPFAEVSTLVAGSVALQDLLDRYVMTVNLQDAGTDAIARLRMLVEEYPDNHKVRSALADLLIDAGRANEGVRELRTIAQHNETIGDLTAMVNSMRRISSAVPTNTEIKAMLVDVYTRRGILDEALRELETLAGLYLERGNAVDSVKCFTRAAEIACAMGDFQHGNELYDQGVAADPNNVPVRHAAVAFYLQTGAVSRAADQLREVVRIALLEEDPDEAIAALHQIIGLAPEDTDAYHKLGEVLTSIGEYSQAERVYRRMAQFAPNDPVLTAKQSALAVLAATR